MAETQDDIIALAGGYVLGTLDAEERAEAERRLLSDAAFTAEVRAWEGRLAPLAETVAPVAPSPDLWAKIEAGISPGRDGERPADQPAPPDPGLLVALRQSRTRWRMATAVTGALAAGLAAFAIFGGMDGLPGRDPAPTRYVAVLNPDGKAPAFLVTVDLAKQALSIRPVEAKRPAGKDYELWVVEPETAPRSLGVLRGGVQQVADRQLVESASLSKAVLAVSLEPEGGSPT
ncbi:MAG: anti-sigma factor, partial [Methyloligellaceae bacterium]